MEIKTKFNIGDEVYVVKNEQTTITLPCELCNDTNKIKAINFKGEIVETSCTHMDFGGAGMYRKTKTTLKWFVSKPLKVYELFFKASANSAKNILYYFLQESELGLNYGKFSEHEVYTKEEAEAHVRFLQNNTLGDKEND